MNLKQLVIAFAACAASAWAEDIRFFTPNPSGSGLVEVIPGAQTAGRIVRSNRGSVAGQAVVAYVDRIPRGCRIGTLPDGEGIADRVGVTIGSTMWFSIQNFPLGVLIDRLPDGSPINVSTNPNDDDIEAFFEQYGHRYKRRVPIGLWASGSPNCVR